MEEWIAGSVDYWKMEMNKMNRFPAFTSKELL
jgi:hypothetical protein